MRPSNSPNKNDDKCGFIKEWLYSFAEGDTPRTLEFSRMEEHIKSCPRCGDRLKRARKFQSSVSSLLGTLKPVRNLRDAVLAEVAIQRPGISTQHGLTALLSVLFIGVLSVMILRPPHTSHTAGINKNGVIDTWDGSSLISRPLRSLSSGDILVGKDERGTRLQADTWGVILTDGLKAQYFELKDTIKFNVISSGRLEVTRRNPGALKIIVTLDQLELQTNDASYELNVRGDASGTIKVTSNSVTIGEKTITAQMDEVEFKQPKK